MAAPITARTPGPRYSSPGAFALALILIRAPPLLPSAAGTLKKGDIVRVPPVHSSPRVTAPPLLSGLCSGGRAGGLTLLEGWWGLPGRGPPRPLSACQNTPALCMLTALLLGTLVLGGRLRGCSPPQAACGCVGQGQEPGSCPVALAAPSPSRWPHPAPHWVAEECR